jgi:hypothetical protein
MFLAPHRFAVTRQLSKTSLASLFFLLSAGTLHAASPFPQNLGNGLDKLVQAKVPAYFNSQSQEQGNGLDAFAIKDSQGRVLVRINPAGQAAAGKPSININSLRGALASSIPSLTVTAVDTTYRGVGVMDAFIDLADVPALAATAGVRSVILELKPRHAPLVQADDEVAKSAARTNVTAGQTLTKLGTTFDQGVTQHGVDQFNQFYNSSAPHDYEGQGMSIGLYFQQL